MLNTLRLTLTVAVAALFSQVASASNPPTFSSTPESLSSVVSASTLLMGDFNGDGIPDLAVFGGTNVQVMFGDGKGGFQSTAPYFTVSSPATTSPAIAVADVNGDGISDLIIADADSVLIYEWNGSSFSQAHSIDLSATGINASAVAVGDVTGKGNRDIVVSDPFGVVGLVVIPNDGKGGFGAATVFPASGSSFSAAFQLTDLNGDGLADAVLTAGTAAAQSNALAGVSLDSAGSFGAESFYSTPSLFANADTRVRLVGTTVADVDGDGKADLVFAVDLFNFDTFADTYYFVVDLGNGDGTFQNSLIFPATTEGFTAITSADVNGDGRADIVTVNYKDSGFTVTEWAGTGAGLNISRTDHISAFGPFFNSITLGYRDTNGTFVTFNKDANPAVFLGTTSYTTTGGVKEYQIDLFTNSTSSQSSGGGNMLGATGIAITNKITPGGVINFVVTQSSTAPGLYVRVQATKTPTNESSWTDLPGGGRLTSNGNGLWTFGATGTTSYPTGKGYYFRAISAAPGYTDSISTNRLGPFTLSQSALSIGVTETSTSDPTGKLGVVHIGDKLIYTFTWTNIGTAPAHELEVSTPVPTYIDATSDLTLQFPSNSLSFNQYGHYVKESAAGAKDAYVWWNVADLAPGSRQSVTLTVQVGSFVRLQQAIGLPNNYEVQSLNQQPGVPATGYSSGAPNVAEQVEGPVAFHVTQDVTTVAPGGYINYILTLTNTGSQTVTNIVIADPVPAGADFVPYSPATKTGTTFLTAKGLPEASPPFSVKVAGRATTLPNPLRLTGLYPSNSLSAGVKAFLAANPQVQKPSDFNDDVVFYVASLAKGASVSVRLTVQAQFEPPSNFTGGAVQNLDYLGYFYEPGGIIAGSKNEQGPITTTVTGAPQNPPVLKLTKIISTETVKPGDVLGVVLVAQNTGNSAADDVFIEDSLPIAPQTQVQPVLITTNVATPQAVTVANLNSAVAIITGGASSTESKTNYFVTLDPGGLITVHGLRLEPGATVGITYFMQILPTTPVPETLYAGGSFVGAGNGSQSPEITPQGVINVSVPPGTPASYNIDVTGYAQLTVAAPIEMVKGAKVTSDANATALQLDALLKKNTNASLVIYTNVGANKNVPVPVPGVQRYSLHYQNVGTNAAPDVHLQFTPPANTEIYRASFINGLTIAKAGPGQSIASPGRLGSGDVIFNLGTVAAGGGGYCQVEVILLPGAISKASSKPIATSSIYSGNPPDSAHARPRDTTATNSGTPAYDGENVPKVGVVQIVPQNVHTNEIFDVQLAVFNYGNVDTTSGAEITFQAPPGAQIIGADGNGGVASLSASSAVIDINFIKHFGSGETIHLKATGAAGSTITINSNVVDVQYVGTLVPMPVGIHIQDGAVAIPNTTITTVAGAQFLTVGEAAVIPLGQYDERGGTAIVCVPASYVTTNQGNTILSASSLGNYIIEDFSTNIYLSNLPILQNTDAGSILANIAKIVGKQGGNVFNGPEDNLIGPDGQSIIDNNTGGVESTIQALLSAGGHSVIASGVGSLSGAGLPPVALGSGAAVTSSTGMVISAGGGAAVVAQALLATASGRLIAQSGSGLLADNGAEVVNTNGSNVSNTSSGSFGAGAGVAAFGPGASPAAPVITTSSDTSALGVSAGGNIVAAGGGNIVAAGGGNIVAAGGGNIVAGGGGN